MIFDAFLHFLIEILLFEVLEVERCGLHSDYGDLSLFIELLKDFSDLEGDSIVNHKLAFV